MLLSHRDPRFQTASLSFPSLPPAGSGFFSTDRTILDYAQNIWGVSGLNRGKLKLDAMGRVRSFGNCELYARPGARC